MVTTPDSSSHSPPSAALSASSAEGTNSPRFPRKNLPSPWAQVVRGADPESLSAIHQSPPSSSPSSSSSSLATSATSMSGQPPSSSDSSPKPAPAPASPPLDNSNSNAAISDRSDATNGNAGRPKKLAWNRPSNGVVEVSPVMGAVSWPALSESTKLSSAKLAVDSSFKTATDGSLPSPQAPVTSNFPQKQAASNANPNPATNYGMPNRQRSVRRGGGNGIGPGPAQSSFTNPSPPPPPPPPPFPVFQMPPSTLGNGVPGVPDPSPRDLYRTRPPVGGFVPPMNEHRSSSRRGNFGPLARGNGSNHNNYGSRRDQERGSYANTRDAHVHQQRIPPRGLVRHLPPNTASFVGPQPIGPFANPVGFPDFYYFPTLPLEPFRGMPFFTHGPPPAMFFPVAETPLTNMIVNQIDYYFSDANLVKDEFLRSNMDEQGWVPITLIASFPRVKNLTNNIELILDSMRTSTIVEVQGDKLRRRNEWMNWLPSAQLRADCGSGSPGGSRYNNPAADFQKITLEEASTDEGNSDPTTDTVDGGCPIDSSTQSQLPNGDATENGN